RWSQNARWPRTEAIVQPAPSRRPSSPSLSRATRARSRSRLPSFSATYERSTIIGLSSRGASAGTLVGTIHERRARDRRVASGAPPADQAEWGPLVPSAVRRTAFGRAGDGAWPAGGAPGDRTRRSAPVAPERSRLGP